MIIHWMTIVFLSFYKLLIPFWRSYKTASSESALFLFFFFFWGGGVDVKDTQHFLYHLHWSPQKDFGRTGKERTGKEWTAWVNRLRYLAESSCFVSGNVSFNRFSSSWLVPCSLHVDGPAIERYEAVVSELHLSQGSELGLWASLYGSGPWGGMSMSR